MGVNEYTVVRKLRFGGEEFGFPHSFLTFIMYALRMVMRCAGVVSVFVCVCVCTYVNVFLRMPPCPV